MPTQTSAKQAKSKARKVAYIGPGQDLNLINKPGMDGHSAQQLAKSRAVLLSYLLKLKKSIDAEHADLTQAICHRFRQHLTDYISYGHFRLLKSCTPQAHQIVALQANTQGLLPFTERYSGHRTPRLPQLKNDLEDLALALEARFEIEDEVVLNPPWQ